MERKGIMTAAQAEKQKAIEMMGSLNARKRIRKKNNEKYKR